MNPLLLLKAAPWIIIVILATSLATMTHLYLGKRDEVAKVTAAYDSFSQRVKAEGEQAQATNAAKDKQHTQSLTQIRNDHEAKQAAIEVNAVANYKRAHPSSLHNCSGTRENTGSNKVSRAGSSEQMDDGAQQELIPVEQGFIQECGNDANKIAAWIAYCRLNTCPIKE